MSKFVGNLIYFILLIIANITLLNQIYYDDIKYTKVVGNINENNIDYEDALMIIDIPKIKLFKKIYKIDSNKNTIEKGIQLIKTGDNIVLASHRGSSKVSYFDKLDTLKEKDVIYLYYKNKKHTYYLDSMYDIPKTGYAKIKRKNKKTLTLITCKKKNKNKQVVYIAYEA